MIEADKGDAEVHEGESLVPYPTENVMISDSDSEYDTNQRIVHISDGDYTPDSTSAGELELFFTGSDDTGLVVPNSESSMVIILATSMQQCNYSHYVFPH